MAHLMGLKSHDDGGEPANYANRLELRLAHVENCAGGSGESAPRRRVERSDRNGESGEGGKSGESGAAVLEERW